MLSDDDIRAIIKKKKKRKAAFRRALASALFLFVLAVMLPSRASTHFDRSLISSVGSSDAEAPDLKAEAAAIYSLDLDNIVYEKNGDEKLDPYSITKIISCYLALEHGDLDRIVKIEKSNEDLNYVDGSHILLLKDEEISIRDLIYATMMASANDAAYALSVAVGGSEAGFAEMMNKQAKEWGCTDTNFVNANGWKNKNHYTTARDMSIITARCFENKDLREISMTGKYIVAATNMSEERELKNAFRYGTAGVNNLVCGKTGTWEDDDCSVVLEFSEDNLNAAIVLLKGTLKSRKSDIEKLQKFSHEVTPGYIVARKDENIAETVVRGGAETNVALTCDGTVYAYPKDHDQSHIKVYLNPSKLEAPVSKGSEAGTFTVTSDGQEIYKGKLLTADDVEKGHLLSRFYISDRNSRIGAGVFVFWLFLMLISRPRRKSKRRNP